LISEDESNSAQLPSLNLLQLAIIHHSSSSALPEIVQALLDAGVDPNEKPRSVSSWNLRNDSDQLKTPVQELFSYIKHGGGSELCKTLQRFVERGADVSGVVNGMSVEGVTKFEGFEDLWEILRSSNNR
jgi:hypothetical protein